jgi:GxxExxY protein
MIEKRPPAVSDPRNARHQQQSTQPRDPLTAEIIAAAIEVHRTLGPGLLESTYVKCLAHEFVERGLLFREQVDVPVAYKGLLLPTGYRLDLLVEEQVVVEVKSVERLHMLHGAQLRTYLRLSSIRRGLLVNFNVPFLVDGLRRYAVGWSG